MTLSMLPTINGQIPRAIASIQVSSCQYNQPAAAKIMGAAPICATASMNMIAVSTTTNGTPAMRDRTARMLCASAVTTTPSATPAVA